VSVTPELLQALDSATAVTALSGNTARPPVPVLLSGSALSPHLRSVVPASCSSDSWCILKDLEAPPPPLPKTRAAGPRSRYSRPPP